MRYFIEYKASQNGPYREEFTTARKCRDRLAYLRVANYSIIKRGRI